MPILKIRGEDGKVYEILALRGPRGLKGVDAYAKVVEYGYEGDEEEFYLAMSRNGQAPDKTLSVSGAYADAKATGDALKEVSAAAQNAQDTADGKAATETYTVTIPTEWTEDGKYYVQDIDVPGVLETDNPIPGVAYGDNDDDNDIYDECFDKVKRITTFDGSIQVRAKEAIGTEFPIQLKVVR